MDTASLRIQGGRRVSLRRRRSRRFFRDQRPPMGVEAPASAPPPVSGRVRSTSGSGPPRSRLLAETAPGPDRSGSGCVVGLSSVLADEGGTAGSVLLAQLRSCSTSVRWSSRFRVDSVTKDSLARWISGPARILGIRAGSVVPSPSVDARSGASTGRLQGVSPPTSPGVFRVPCDLRTTCSFLGFVSPPRLSRASDDTSREVSATARSPGRSSRLRLPFSLR